MKTWNDDKRDEFNQNEFAEDTPKKRKFGLSGSDANESDGLNPFSAKSLQLRPTSSSSSLPPTRKNYDRQVGQSNISVRNRFNTNDVQQEKVHILHASIILLIILLYLQQNKI
jgi:hypothetical protein